MITLKNVTLDQFNAAIKRAERDGVSIAYPFHSQGLYIVVSGDKSYEVQFTKVNGLLQVACSCQATGFCKHIAICCVEHKEYLVEKRHAECAAQVPPPEVAYRVVCVVVPPKDIPARSPRPEPTEEELAKIRSDLFD